MTFFQPRPSILAIHGSASSSRQWQSLIAAVGPACSVNAPTLPDANADTRLGVVLDEIVDTQTRVHLIAHSFGASVAMKLANTVPEIIASVTLYDPVVPIDVGGRMGAASALRDLSWVMQLAGAEQGMALFLDFWACDGAWAASSSRRRAALIARYPSVMRDFDQMDTGAWTPSTILYDGPLALFQGERSPSVITETTGYLKRSYPNAWSHILPDLDHMTPLTDPKVTDGIFLHSILTQGMIHHENQAA